METKTVYAAPVMPAADFREMMLQLTVSHMLSLARGWQRTAQFDAEAWAEVLERMQDRIGEVIGG